MDSWRDRWSTASGGAGGGVSTGTTDWLDHRCERLLWQGRCAPFVWIDGPPGAGKTLLAEAAWRNRRGVRMWLALETVDVRAGKMGRRLGAAICQASGRPVAAAATAARADETAALLEGIEPWTIVLDGAEAVAASQEFTTLLTSLVQRCRNGGFLLVTSRTPPPLDLARLWVEGGMERIAGPQLRLSPGEARGIAGALLARPSAAAVEHALQESRGWLAGFRAILLAGPRDAAPLLGHYLEREILARLSAMDRELLDFLAPLEALSPDLLQAILEPGEVERLRELARTNCLIEQGSEQCEIHPLLRAHLLARLARPDAHERSAALRRRLAALLEAAGRIEEAMEHWLAAHAWPQARAIILALVPEALATGRHEQVAAWIERVPAAHRGPGSLLHVWHALARIPLDDTATESALEAAWSACRARGDRTGMALAWSGMVEAAWLHWGRFDHVRWLLEELDALGPQGLDDLSPSTAARMVTAACLLIGLLAPGSSRHPGWLAAAEATARRSLATGERLGLLQVLLMLATWVRGDRERAHRIREMGRVVEAHAAMLPPVQEQMWHAAVAGYEIWFDEDTEAGQARIRLALQRSAEHGVQLWDSQLAALGACSALRLGDGESAARWLEQTRRATQPHLATDASFQLWVCAWHRMRCGELAAAAGLADEARALIAGCGPQTAQMLAHHACARILHLRGEVRRALGAALALDRWARAESTPLYQWLARLTIARALAECGRWRWARRLVRSTLALGRTHGFVCLPFHLPGDVVDLCNRGREAGVDVEYLRALARANGVPGAASLEQSRHRLSPQAPLRLDLLAGGRLRAQGRDVVVRGKGAYLLHRVAAAGEPGIAHVELADELWPDAEGDRARSAFDTLLHRLRKRLGHAEAIRLEEGRLRLDRSLWQLDIDQYVRDLDMAAQGDLAVWDTTLAALERTATVAADWPGCEGTRLRRRFRAAAMEAVRCMATAGRLDAAMDALPRILAIAPDCTPVGQILLAVARDRSDPELARTVIAHARAASTGAGHRQLPERLELQWCRMLEGGG